jgi:hypothetical protein
MVERRARKNESGFALLLVFLMAAVIAISLYLEMPRLAFESQRQKEQLLIERGEQYKRAIRVFVNTNKRWPAKIEDLENFNNRRFLRKRYIDPMTGKDEWRVVHIQNGVLTDSINNKNQNQNSQQATTTGQYVGEVAAVGQTAGPGTGVAAGGAAMANRRRASDGSTPGVDTPGGMPNPAMAGMQPGVGYPQQPGAQVGQPMPGQYPAGVPQIPGSNPQAGMPQLPGMPGAPGQIPGQVPGQTPTPQQIIQGRMNPTLPGAQQQGQQSQQTAGSSYVGSGSYIGGSIPTAQPSTPTNSYPQPGQPQPYTGSPGTPVNSQTGGVSPQYNQPYVPYGTVGGAQGATPAYPSPSGQPGDVVNPQQTSAAQQMINNALFGPRPGGAPVQTVGGMGTVMGAGIAGFASKADADSIMTYNDQTNYGHWEFIYDPAKQKALLNPLSASNGTPVSAMAGSAPGGGIGSINALGAVQGATPVSGNAQPIPQAQPQNIQPGYSPLLNNDGNTVRPPGGGAIGNGNPLNTGYGINPIRQ